MQQNLYIKAGDVQDGTTFPDTVNDLVKLIAAHLDLIGDEDVELANRLDVLSTDLPPGINQEGTLWIKTTSDGRVTSIQGYGLDGWEPVSCAKSGTAEERNLVATPEVGELFLTTDSRTQTKYDGLTGEALSESETVPELYVFRGGIKTETYDPWILASSFLLKPATQMKDGGAQALGGVVIGDNDSLHITPNGALFARPGKLVYPGESQISYWSGSNDVSPLNDEWRTFGLPDAIPLGSDYVPGDTNYNIMFEPSTIIIRTWGHCKSASGNDNPGSNIYIDFRKILSDGTVLFPEMEFVRIGHTDDDLDYSDVGDNSIFELPYTPERTYQYKMRYSGGAPYSWAVTLKLLGYRL